MHHYRDAREVTMKICKVTTIVPCFCCHGCFRCCCCEWYVCVDSMPIGEVISTEIRIVQQAGNSKCLRDHHEYSNSEEDLAAMFHNKTQYLPAASMPLSVQIHLVYVLAPAVIPAFSTSV